ncbi:hypothetical protein JW887_02395 [Candidatus Dojkabacteria bacterium]|nr:hypothetical protein [Candidatus Dojkabacteria bacterium]
MENVTFITLVTAAIADSINPCAIGVLVFMITFLANLKVPKKKMLAIGFTYILMVFVSYYLAGIGILNIITKIPFLDIIYKILGGIVLIAGVIDIYDGIRNSQKPLLAIPRAASPHIKNYIRKATIPAAIALGAIVALFELPCSGFVYFAILGMMSKSQMQVKGYLYLAIYNFIFVLPLIIILLLSTFGLSSEKVQAWKNNNKGLMRIIIGFAMVLLGVLMISDIV